MTIPYLGGAGENLSGLTAIADAVGQLLNPNEQFRRQAQALFLEKPELMQKFVDVEKANPGTLKAFGFGDKATNLLSGMQESIPALVARQIAPKVADELQTPDSKATRSAVTQAVSGQTPGQLEADDFSGWFAKEGKNLLDKDPELFIRAARAKFGTGTEFENELEKDTQTNYHSAKYLRETPPMQIVQDIAGGKLSMTDISGLMSGPEKLGIDAAMKLYQTEREGQIRMNLARFGQENNSIQRAKLTSAYDSWESSGRKGSLAGWYNYMWGSPDFGAPLPSDKADIEASLKNQQADLRTNQLTKMFKSIEPLIKSIEKDPGDESVKSNQIARINDVLKENHSQWTAFWNEKGLFNFGKLSFRGPEGVVTDDPSSLVTDIPLGTEHKVELTGEQNALAQRLKGLTGPARAAFIQQIRTRASDTAVAEEIIKQGGGE
jgi:hypothetical protein